MGRIGQERARGFGFESESERLKGVVVRAGMAEAVLIERAVLGQCHLYARMA